MGECRICGRNGETRHLPIYVTGSEGVDVCQACEIDIVNFIRSMMSTSARTKLALIKRQKNI